MDEKQERPETHTPELEPLEDKPAAPPPPPPPPPSSSAGFKRLHKFLWGGLMIVVGSLLPFGGAVVSTMYGDVQAMEKAGGEAKARAERLAEIAERLGSGELAAAADRAREERESDDDAFRMPARRAFDTFTGALFLLIGLLLVVQMREAIAERKVILGGVLLSLFPAGWTWFKLVTITGSLSGFSWGEMYKLAAWERLALDVGSGFLVLWIGSTYVVIQFVKALLGAASGGKKPQPAAAGRGSRSRRR